MHLHPTRRMATDMEMAARSFEATFVEASDFATTWSAKAPLRGCAPRHGVIDVERPELSPKVCRGDLCSLMPEFTADNLSSNTVL